MPFVEARRYFSRASDGLGLTLSISGRHAIISISGTLQAQSNFHSVKRARVFFGMGDDLGKIRIEATDHPMQGYRVSRRPNTKVARIIFKNPKMPVCKMTLAEEVTTNTDKAPIIEGFIPLLREAMANSALAGENPVPEPAPRRARN